MSGRNIIRAATVALVAVCVLALASPALGQTFTPTRTGDPAPDGCRKHDCSLREAVIRANAHPGTDTIVLQAGKTYRLTIGGDNENASLTGDLDATSLSPSVGDTLVIKSSGRRRATIQQAVDQPAYRDRVLEAYYPTNLTLSRIVAKGGDASPDGDDGAGIRVSGPGDLRLVRSVVRGNTTTGSGGGIFADNGSLDPSKITLIRSAVVSNHAGSGGGISLGVAPIQLTMRRSKVVGNTADGFAGGGGIYLAGNIISPTSPPVSAEIDNSHVDGNKSTQGAGGGLSLNSAVVNLMHSTLSRNRVGDQTPAAYAGGGAYVSDSSPAGQPSLLTAHESTIAGNSTGDFGGGLYVAGIANIARSTLSGNSAGNGGGGMEVTGANGVADVGNSTLAGNQADHYGGGIDAFGGSKVTLEQSTVAYNKGRAHDVSPGRGGGIWNGNSSPGAFTVGNSVVAANTVGAGGSDPDCGSEPSDFTTGFGNVLGVQSSSCTGFTQFIDIFTTTPGLGPLANNGGPTQTVALGATSPAINHWSGTLGTCPFDQRGAPRTLDGGTCDSGAYERLSCQGVLINRVGTGVGDTLTGTSKRDGILAQGGNDTLLGLGAKDGLCGGTGRDRLNGGRGDDALNGGPGTDTCIGGPGTDTKISCEH